MSAFERAEQVIQDQFPVARLRDILDQPIALKRGQVLKVFEDGGISLEASCYDDVADFACEQLSRPGSSALLEASGEDEVANELGDVCDPANLTSFTGPFVGEQEPD